MHAALNYAAKIISIHALRGEGDQADKIVQRYTAISIHALRGEGDLRGCALQSTAKEISIHALRGEGDLDDDGENEDYECISIHALRGEGDQKRNTSRCSARTFQSTPSVGRATLVILTVT